MLMVQVWAVQRAWYVVGAREGGTLGVVCLVFFLMEYDLIAAVFLAEIG
jgi:hypothetical protein